MQDPEQLEEIYVLFPTIQDAMRIAGRKALAAQAGSKQEYAGAVFERQTPNGPRYYYSDPQSSGGEADVTIKATAKAQGDKPVAIYHTHPKGPSSEKYSPYDVGVAKSLGKPSYLFPDGQTSSSYIPKAQISRNRFVKGEPFLTQEQLAEIPPEMRKRLLEIEDTFAGTMQ